MKAALADLPATIKARCKALGIKQAELSRRSGLTEAAISRYLSGDRQPTLEAGAALARALDMSVDQLLGGITSTDGVTQAPRMASKST